MAGTPAMSDHVVNVQIDEGFEQAVSVTGAHADRGAGAAASETPWKPRAWTWW